MVCRAYPEGADVNLSFERTMRQHDDETSTHPNDNIGPFNQTAEHDERYGAATTPHWQANSRRQPPLPASLAPLRKISPTLARLLLKLSLKRFEAYLARAAALLGFVWQPVRHAFQTPNKVPAIIAARRAGLTGMRRPSGVARNWKRNQRTRSHERSVAHRPWRGAVHTLLRRHVRRCRRRPDRLPARR